MSTENNKKKNIHESAYELEDSGYFSPIYTAPLLNSKDEKNTLSCGRICGNDPRSCDRDSSTIKERSNEKIDILLKRIKGRTGILPKDTSPIKYLIFNESDTDFFNYVDFISELKPYPHILQNIYRHLSLSDLCRICCVSKTWNKLCQLHSSLRKRKILFLQKQSGESINEKENAEKKNIISMPGCSRSFGNSQPVCTNETVQPKPTAQKPSTSKFQMFIEEGKKLPHGGKLIKCPQCSSPSQILPQQQHGQCTKENCNYNFCIRCLNKFLPSHNCSSRGTSIKDGIGSKRSYKNLRRLTK